MKLDARIVGSFFVRTHSLYISTDCQPLASNVKFHRQGGAASKSAPMTKTPESMTENVRRPAQVVGSGKRCEFAAPPPSPASLLGVLADRLSEPWHPNTAGSEELAAASIRFSQPPASLLSLAFSLAWSSLLLARVASSTIRAVSRSRLLRLTYQASTSVAFPRITVQLPPKQPSLVVVSLCRCVAVCRRKAHPLCCQPLPCDVTSVLSTILSPQQSAAIVAWVHLLLLTHRASRHCRP